MDELQSEQRYFTQSSPPSSENELSEQDRTILTEIENAMRAAPSVSAARDEPRETIGLYELFEALTAQRHELKLHTKASRNLEESTTAAMEAMNRAVGEYRDFQRQTLHIFARADERIAEALKPVLLAVAEIDESLARLQNAFQKLREEVPRRLRERTRTEFDDFHDRLPFWKRLIFRKTIRAFSEQLQESVVPYTLEPIESFGSGFDLLRTKIERFFTKHRISRIGHIGEPVVPETMTVVEIVDDAEVPSGCVAKILRPGYLWKETVLRFAEVATQR